MSGQAEELQKVIDFYEDESLLLFMDMIDAIRQGDRAGEGLINSWCRKRSCIAMWEAQQEMRNLMGWGG